MNTYLKKILSLQSEIEVIYNNSVNAAKQFSGERTVIKDYTFTAIEKIAKISSGVKPLLSLLPSTIEVEFPIGILLRSLLMDSILMLSVTQLSMSTTDENIEENRQLVTKQCKKLSSDGTWHFINEIKNNPIIDIASKRILIEKFSNKFPGAIIQRGNNHITADDFKVSIAQVYNTITHPDLQMKEQALYLYNIYSKYDHLSYWTAASKSFSIERRIEFIESSLLTTLFHLKDTLFIAFIFEPSCISIETQYNNVVAHLKNKIPEQKEI